MCSFDCARKMAVMMLDNIQIMITWVHTEKRMWFLLQGMNSIVCRHLRRCDNDALPWWKVINLMESQPLLIKVMIIHQCLLCDSPALSKIAQVVSLVFRHYQTAFPIFDRWLIVLSSSMYEILQGEMVVHDQRIVHQMASLMDYLVVIS